MKKELYEWGKAILITAVIFGVLGIFFSATTVYSTSMEPALVEKDMLLLFKLGSVNRGDIISFKSELRMNQRDIDSLNFVQKIFNKVGDRKNLIKRVIALPGETVEIRDGSIYINGEKLTEDYIDQPTYHDFGAETVPKDQYFVLGDNRGHSLDSRALGYVKKKDIIGKTLFRFMPLTKLGKVK